MTYWFEKPRNEPPLLLNMDPKEIGLSHAVSVSLTPVLSYHRNWLIVNSHIFLPQYFIQIAGTGVVNDNVDLTTAS